MLNSTHFLTVAVAVTVGAKDDGGGGGNWSYKAAVKPSPPVNQHPAFYRLDAYPLPNQQCHSSDVYGITCR